MSKDPYDDEPGRHLRSVSADSGQMVAYDPLQVHMEDDETIDLREYWRILVKRRWVVLSVLMIVVVATVLSTVLMVPVYRSTAAVQITPPGSQILEFGDFTSDQRGWQATSNFYSTQYEILRSRGLAEAVVRNEGVEDHPELTGELRQRSVLGELKSLPGTIKKALSPQRDVADQDLSAQDERERAIKAAAETLRLRLDIEPVRDSNLVDVSVEAFDPGFAARMANAVVAEYTRSSMQRRYAAGNEARDFLEDQLSEMRISLERADQALLDFAQRNNVADLDQRITMATSTLNNLNQRLSEIETELITLDSYKQMIERGQARDVSAVNDSEEIRALRQQRAAMATEYASLSQRFKEDYPTLVELREQMDEISDQIAQERTLAIRDILGRHNGLSSEAESLRAAIEAREGAILALNQQGVQYNILKRDFETNRELYDGLLQRMKEIGVAAGVQENNIAVIDAAIASAAPFKPNLSRNLALALVLGLMGGVGLALVLEFFDSNVHRTEDLEALTSRPVLSQVPVVKARDMRKDNQQFSLPERAVGHYSARFPNSPVSEAFRLLRTSLMFSTPEGMPQIVLVTSPGPGDGKTTTAINLATVMAQNGSRVLLIDADLRRPRLHGDFGKTQSPGLSNRIAGIQADSSEKSAIVSTDVNGLFLMPSGTAAPNPAELLSSKSMRKIVATAARSFDQVIIDTPPILGLADAMVLSSIADGVIVVTMAGVTPKDGVKASMRRLAQVRAPVLGMVLNGVDLDSPDYAYYSSSYYYDDSPNEEADAGDTADAQGKARVLGGTA